MPISPVARQCLFDAFHKFITVGHFVFHTEEAQSDSERLLRGTASDNINQLGHTETSRSLYGLTK